MKGAQTGAVFCFGSSYLLQRYVHLKSPPTTHVYINFSLSIVVLLTLSLASGQGRGLETGTLFLPTHRMLGFSLSPAQRRGVRALGASHAPLFSRRAAIKTGRSSTHAVCVQAALPQPASTSLDALHSSAPAKLRPPRLGRSHRPESVSASRAQAQSSAAQAQLVRSDSRGGAPQVAEAACALWLSIPR
jgi:hypothetical protein